MERLDMQTSGAAGSGFDNPSSGGGAFEAGAEGATVESRSRAREVKEQVVQQAKETIGDVKQRANTTLDQGRNQLAEQVGSVARAFHATTDQLRTDQRDDLAQYAERVAGQIDEVADYLRTHDLQALLGDIERLAHRQPTLFVGAAFALGLMGGRFLKSSEQRRYGRSPSEIGPGTSPALPEIDRTGMSGGSVEGLYGAP